MLGAGILGLPRTLDAAGIVLGPFLITLGAVGAGFGLWLLGACSLKLKERPSYHSLAQASLSGSGVFVDAAVALKCFGVACSYLVVIGRLFPDAFRFFETGISILEDRHFWQSALMAIIAPLCLLHELRTLRHVSLAALVAIIFLAIFIATYFFGTALPEGQFDELPLVRAHVGTLHVLPTIVFSFTCHQNMPVIVAEMSDQRMSAIVRVLTYALALCWAVLLTAAVLGYLTFGDNITSNVIDCYPVDHVGANMVRLAVGMSCLACIPFQIHPARTSITNLLGHAFPSTASPGRARALRIALGLGLCGAMYMVAFFLTDLGVLFAVVGATGSTLMCYLFPGFFYVRMHPGGWPAARIGAAALCALTPVIMACGLYAAVN